VDVVNGSARPVFERAARFFVATTSLVGPEQWERPGMGEWSVRDLVGHTSRALLTVETYLDHPAAAAEVATPVDYFLKALASIGDPARVAQRGREAGAALGLDPAGAIREIADRVLALVARTDEAQLVATPIGGMHLGVYLTTRTFELVVHTLDLATAINTPAQPPPEALAASLELAAGLALRSGRGAEALLALTGRRPLPPGFSVV
jgi:uncharacterized protein (TIGR03083 family)